MFKTPLVPRDQQKKFTRSVCEGVMKWMMDQGAKFDEMPFSDVRSIISEIEAQCHDAFGSLTQPAPVVPKEYLELDTIRAGVIAIDTGAYDEYSQTIPLSHTIVFHDFYNALVTQDVSVFRHLRFLNGDEDSHVEFVRHLQENPRSKEPIGYTCAGNPIFTEPLGPAPDFLNLSHKERNKRND